MITIKHLAARLDLSVATVGRALTDHPRISRATKDRVRALAQELGYVASNPARVMRGGSSHLIGFLVPDIRSSFYATAAQVLSECLDGDNFHLALSITDDAPETELQEVRALLSARVAGIVLVPSAEPLPETMALLATVPHVQLLRRHPSLGDWFGIDDAHALALATTHLLELGHRRIGYIGDVIYDTGRARLAGYRRALAASGCAPDEALIELGPPEAAFGAAALARLAGGPAPPTAIVTTSVLVTLGAAEQAASLGFDTPGALSLVGFGDGDWQRWWGPGLTTLRLPVEEIAAGCGRLLLGRLRDRETAATPVAFALPASLVVRGSAGPPARKGR